MISLFYWMQIIPRIIWVKFWDISKLRSDVIYYDNKYERIRVKEIKGLFCLEVFFNPMAKVPKKTAQIENWNAIASQLETRRIGNVRTHTMFRPRSFTFLIYLATKLWRDKKKLSTHISFKKPLMEKSNATLEGWLNLLLIGLLERQLEKSNNKH